MLGSRLLLAVVLAFSLGVLAVACSDDENEADTASGSLDAYFAELGVIGNEFLDSLVLQPEGIDSSAPIADQVDVYETYLNGLSRDIESAQEDLNDLDPPAEATDAHADLLAAVENAATTAEEIESQIGDINSSEDMQALVNNQDILTALAEFRVACVALQELAADNSIDRVVRCE